MVIPFSDTLDATFLNSLEEKLDSFDPDFINKAASRCLPLLPESFFEDPGSMDDLKAHLCDFYGLEIPS